ncbi:hypothetical protein ABBQ32_005216 [Trebouxia sp. C0010 RCD-2024]
MSMFEAYTSLLLALAGVCTEHSRLRRDSSDRSRVANIVSFRRSHDFCYRGVCLREASTDTAWQNVSAYLSCQREEIQWRGVRLLHIKLQQGPRSAADFAELPDCRARIDVLVQLLTKPATDPMNQFPLDVSASTSMRIGRPPRHLIQQVMQAQMVGLVLGVLAQLALADSYSLAQHIYKLEGLQLLHDIAMGRTQHAHPELQDASEVRKL